MIMKRVISKIKSNIWKFSSIWQLFHNMSLNQTVLYAKLDCFLSVVDSLYTFINFLLIVHLNVPALIFYTLIYSYCSFWQFPVFVCFCITLITFSTLLLTVSPSFDIYYSFCDISNNNCFFLHSFGQTLLVRCLFLKKESLCFQESRNLILLATFKFK